MERASRAMGHRAVGSWLGYWILGVCVMMGGCLGPGNNPAPEGPPPTLALRPGDEVTITFSHPRPPGGSRDHQEEIKSNGFITPPHLESIQAAGKTPAELQSRLQKEYNKLYKDMTVTVNAGARFYTVNGEVQNPGRFAYSGEMTLVDAIADASGITDFGNRRKVRVTRRNGERHTVNYREALNNDEADIPIYPGDQIYVPRRLGLGIW